MGWGPLIEVTHQPAIIELGFLPWTIGFSLIVGLLGSVYVRGYGLAVKVFRRDQGRVVLKVVVGMAAASLLVWLVNPALLGTAAELTGALSNGEPELLYGAFAATTPLALVAIAAARFVQVVAGQDLAGAFPAVGFAGMLAGSMNVPIAAAVLAVEVFGTGLGTPAIFASVIGFQMNRHSTIYDFALAGSGHMDEGDRRSDRWTPCTGPRLRLQSGR